MLRRLARNLIPRRSEIKQDFAPGNCAVFILFFSPPPAADVTLVVGVTKSLQYSALGALNYGSLELPREASGSVQAC